MKRDKTPDLSPELKRELVDFAKQRDAKRLILFGSRARGDAGPRSDVDLAIEGANDVDAFRRDVDERANTLLMFDVVDPAAAPDELLEEIRADGIGLYEKIR